MREDDRLAFAELLADALAFYRQDVSRFALQVWWQACEPFSLEQVSRALTVHAMDPERGQFAPKPADMVRALRGTATDRSLIAWGKVMDAMQRVGAYQSVAFDDPAIHSAIEDIGGWPAICRSDVDELPFLQRRFTEAHRVYAARPDTSHPPRLVGEFESRNALHGKAVAAPILVGDSARALRVMATGSSVGKTSMVAADVVPMLSRRTETAA